MVAVHDFCFDVGRNGGKSLDRPLCGIADFVASDEEQSRHRKSLPIVIGEHRGKHEPTPLEAPPREYVFVDHLVDRRTRCVVADTIWRVPVVVPSNN